MITALSGEKLKHDYLLLFKMFVEVPYTQLVAGKKYKIDGSYQDNMGIYIMSFGEGPHIRLLFTKLKGINSHSSRSCSFALSRFNVFHKFVSDNPQSKMERRAVNLIVRRILGDDCFEW